MKLIRKPVYLFLLSSMLLQGTMLSASNYDEDVLEIFSKILPRFILMSNKKNALTEQIEICVLNDKLDERTAQSLMSKIDANYPNGIKNYKIKFVDGSYSNLAACQNSQLLFMFDTTEQNIEKGIKFSQEHKALSMSYDAKYLENGVGASLFLGRKVVPYINMNAIRKNSIELDNLLVRISKIYVSEDAK